MFAPSRSLLPAAHHPVHALPLRLQVRAAGTRLSMELKRFDVDDRLSEMAIYNKTVYLAGQVGAVYTCTI